MSEKCNTCSGSGFLKATPIYDTEGFRVSFTSNPCPECNKRRTPLSAAMELPEVKARIEAAYLAGFNSSGEGWNGEYPFQDNNQDPTQDNHWAACRDAALAAIKEPKT